MSGLSMRTRIITVVAASAVVAPFALMGGSAQAAEGDLPIGGLGSATGLLGGDDSGLGLGPVDGVLGTATGLLGATDGLPVLGGMTEGVGTAGAAGATEELPLGSLLDLEVLEGVTDLVELEDVLETVTELVDIEDVLKTVTKLVNIEDLLDLDLEKLINLPVKVNKHVKHAKDAKDGKDGKTVVRAGALPKTGGNADMTALLLCAGLAVAGTGVTLVTRRRNALGMSA